ncbi:MAG: type II toxin-antitoxin system RelE/ParE family toxin [Saprospiraceae bacterium]
MNEEYDIGWSNRVAKDLLKIKAYLLENASETVAQKVLLRLYNSVEPTRKQPERFPLEPRLKKHGNFRFIKVWNYKIIYEFTGNQIIVHRIIHSKRDMKRALRGIR